MDDRFMDTLKSFSVKDLLNDNQQRPTTSRLFSARGGRNVPGTAMFGFGSSTNSNGMLFGGGNEKQSTSVEAFEQNKPKTAGRVRTSWGVRHSDSSAVMLRPGTSSAKGPNKLSNDEIVDFIPDLNDLEEEDFAMSVASAPRFEAQRITSLSELDAELNTRKAFSVVRGVDLRKLTKFLCPEKDLIDTQILFKEPSHSSDDPEEQLREVRNYLYDALFTDVSTTFEEKQSQRGGTEFTWEGEDVEKGTEALNIEK